MTDWDAEAWARNPHNPRPLCEVCHVRHTHYYNLIWGAFVCSRNCAAEVAGRFSAYREHRASRTNTWPTSDEWRRFAAAVADWFQTHPGRPMRDAWMCDPGTPWQLREGFIDGFGGRILDAIVNQAYRLGAEYRRLQEERGR